MLQNYIVDVLEKNDFCPNMSDDFSGFSKRSQLEPDEFYYSEEGYIVFTEKYHLKRGYCCKNGCKHCPYGFSLKKKRRN